VHIEKIQEQLKKDLPPALYAHSAGVAETAAGLARTLHADEKKAYLAGWLHDCARSWPAEELLSFARNNNLEIDELTKRQPILLHGAAGAALAKSWGILDAEILSAVANHTLGCPGMSLLGQIIYLADKIEPNRQYPGVDGLRELARVDFHAGVLEASAQSISYVLKKQKNIHPMSISFWNWLVERHLGGE
jgi:predicted HD superfamily hydrolase involved in NAD metabolism